MLVVLENLHWADPSSLDLFHFLARSAAAHPLVLLATYNDAQRESHRTLRATEQSLLSLGVLARHSLAPLTRLPLTQRPGQATSTRRTRPARRGPGAEARVMTWKY